VLGLAVLTGLLVFCASHFGARTSTTVAAPLSPPRELLALLEDAPAVDLSPDDDETARDLKDRTTDTNAVTGPQGWVSDVRVFLASNSAAELMAAGRIARSLGPRAPPQAHKFDLRRLAWQA
jgi:hypothetical protein